MSSSYLNFAIFPNVPRRRASIEPVTLAQCQGEDSLDLWSPERNTMALFHCLQKKGQNCKIILSVVTRTFVNVLCIIFSLILEWIFFFVFGEFYRNFMSRRQSGIHSLQATHDLRKNANVCMVTNAHNSLVSIKFLPETTPNGKKWTRCIFLFYLFPWINCRPQRRRNRAWVLRRRLLHFISLLPPFNRLVRHLLCGLLLPLFFFYYFLFSFLMIRILSFYI